MADRWWSTPMEGEKGGRVIVTAREVPQKTIQAGKYPYLIRVSWNYNSDKDGFPDAIDAELMGRAADAIEATFKKDKAAIPVAIITGEGCRDWLFYTGSLPIFGKVFNRALESIPETIPFVIEAEADPDWSQYLQIKEDTYIAPDAEEKD